MTNISNEELVRIRSSVNIVDIIGSYINLEKHGKNYFGICPFHDDHSPSMSVSSEKQIYTCFVCGASGNVFTFLMNYLNISFLEAVNIVASKSGINIDSNVKIVKKYNDEYNAYNLAIKYYKNNLNTSKGIDAINYLKTRDISEDIINEFDIGVSFNDNGLSKLLSKKFNSDMLYNVGLVNKNDDIYDLFRNRIMFPIHNSNGDPIGFSARIYDNSSNEAKYINTRETYIFKKGCTLFNYHRAINEVKKKNYLILCEGQMDAIRIYSSGIKNVCATMGTALTNDHVKLIKRLNRKVILNMDSDSAGVNAAINNGEILTKAGIEVSVVKLDGAKDPDLYITKYGADKYLDAINHSISYIEFKLNSFKENKNLDNEYDLSNYINSVINELNNIDDDILKNIKVNEISEKYNIDKKILLDKLVKKEVQSIVKPNIIKKKSIKKNMKAVYEILYYMMNSVKYSKIFLDKLNYIPSDKYYEIERDIQAYIIINNTINMADFISYEMSNGKYEIVNEIILNHDTDIEMNDDEFNNYIKIVENWINDIRINELKNELKIVSDINRKTEIMDKITNIKRRSESNGK